MQTEVAREPLQPYRFSTVTISLSICPKRSSVTFMNCRQRPGTVELGGKEGIYGSQGQAALAGRGATAEMPERSPGAVPGSQRTAEAGSYAGTDCRANRHGSRNCRHMA